MNNGGTIPGPGGVPEQSIPCPVGAFELQVSLSGMDADDALRIDLAFPAEEISLSTLLDQVFPEDTEQQRRVTSLLDLRANPDLPDIYDAILDAFDEWRSGRCALYFSGHDKQPLDLSDPVITQMEPDASPPEDKRSSPPPFRKGGLGGFSPVPSLHLHVHRQYRAVEFAIQQGFWSSKTELLEWMGTHTLLYFMDKHELSLQASPSSDAGHTLLPIAHLLQAMELIALSQETNTFAITEEGRRFIGRLLAETESYIDLYDHFKDTAFEEDAVTVEFDTGHGADLRVPVFIAEGLDPIRTVFLLRLYDGTLDAFAPTWQELILDESFFDGILEPVVNRQDVEEPLLDRIVGAGFVYLEEKHEEARELADQQEIIQRVQAES